MVTERGTSRWRRPGWPPRPWSGPACSASAFSTIFACTAKLSVRSTVSALSKSCFSMRASTRSCCVCQSFDLRWRCRRRARAPRRTGRRCFSCSSLAASLGRRRLHALEPRLGSLDHAGQTRDENELLVAVEAPRERLDLRRGTVTRRPANWSTVLAARRDRIAVNDVRSARPSRAGTTITPNATVNLRPMVQAGCHRQVS